MALVMDQDFQARARSLGYSRLLMLQERDFKRLLQQYPMLREKIDQIVRQRLRAVEVWQQFESGERQHEPLPDLGRTAVEQAPADAAQAPEPASAPDEAGARDPGPDSPSTAAT
jgi:CPA1 family monovalent cation:H+ antiporter